MAKKKVKPAKVKRFHIRAKDREYFTSNLALLLKATVPVAEALGSLKDTSKSKPLKKALEQMIADIDEGTSLWKALERSGIVSEQTLALIRLGEQSGNLVENLRIAARQEEKQRLFRTKVRSALLYPGFVLGLTGVVGLGVSWFLLPRLSQTFSELDVNLPFISRVLIGFGDFLKERGIIFVPLILICFSVMVYIVFIAPKTRTLGQRLLFRLPGISGLLREVEISRLGYLLGTLLEAGLSITQSLNLLCDATSAPAYKSFYKYLKTSFDNGFGFQSGLKNYKNTEKLLPAAVQQMIIAGERSGGLSETLSSIGAIYEEKADSSTENLETILEPILLIIVWLGVMGVAIAVILPIYSLVGGLEG